ncbi:MAG TPA: DUF1579 domain-containing protein [Phycisphaerae bacterium]|nr:DUF1579 domain-containing protein [Phycisphaerae bacterium]
MKRFGYLLGAMAVCGFALMVPSVIADEPKADHGHDHAGHDHADHEHKDGDAAATDPMEEMAKYAAPGPQHAMLQKAVGTWKTEIKHWMEPGEPMESTGKSVIKSVMDGRYIEEHFTSDMMGQPFVGRSILGYDNVKGKYVSIWFDNMGTGISQMEGTYDEATKTLTTSGISEMTPGEKTKMRMTDKEVDKDTHMMEMYMSMGEGAPEMKVMEIKYTREKSVANAN